jgi:hypothetical protein
MIVKHLNQIELSRRWSLSPRTLERWRWLQQGPCWIRVGGRVIYRLSDIEEYEQAQLRGRSARVDATPTPNQQQGTPFQK